jgi:F0F1-type ATP synthase assembly protein I
VASSRTSVTKKKSSLPKRPLKRVAELSGIGLQLAATIFAGAYLGSYLDDHYPLGEKRIYTLLLTLLFTAAAMFNVLRQINKNDES